MKTTFGALRRIVREEFEKEKKGPSILDFHEAKERVAQIFYESNHDPSLPWHAPKNKRVNALAAELESGIEFLYRRMLEKLNEPAPPVGTDRTSASDVSTARPQLGRGRKEEKEVFPEDESERWDEEASMRAQGR